MTRDNMEWLDKLNEWYQRTDDAIQQKTNVLFRKKCIQVEELKKSAELKRTKLLEDKVSFLEKNNAMLRSAFIAGPYKTMIVNSQGQIVLVNNVKLTSGDRVPEIGSIMYMNYAAKHKGINMYEELRRCRETNEPQQFLSVNYNNQVYLNIEFKPLPTGDVLIISNDIGPVPKDEYLP